MDYTKLLDETRDLMNDFVASNDVNSRTFYPSEKSFARPSDGFGFTFLSKGRNLNETTFINPANQPGATVALRISKSFAEIMDEGDKTSVLDKVEKFIETLKFERSLAKESEKNQFLFLELNTWQLIMFLFQNRLFGHESPVDVEMIVENNYSHQIIVDAVNQSWPELRELAAIIKWLELVFVNPQSVPPLGFSYLQNTLCNTASTKFKQFLYHLDSEFDPQAPVDVSDNSNTAQFMSYAFYLIRGGRFTDMEEYSKKMGYVWLPLILQGQKLFHDPNYVNSSGHHIEVRGNKQRELWNRTCVEIMKNPKVGKFEKAIYAYCSGNVTALLPACKTWEDKLWCYLTCLVSAVQNYSLSLYANNDVDSIEDRPEVDLKDILMKIDALEDSGGQKSPLKTFFQGVQTCIILNTMDRSLISRLLFDDFEDDQSLSALMSRFSATLCIIASQLSSFDFTEQIERHVSSFGENLVSYFQVQAMEPIIAYLKFTGNPEMVCFKLLLKLDKSEHDLFLELIEKAGLDSSVIRKKLIAHFQGKYRPEASETEDLTPEEHVLIDSTLKLRSLKENPVNFLSSVNSLGRTFLGMKRYLASSNLFTPVPVSVVDDAIQFHRNVSMTSDLVVNLPAREANIISEFLNMRNVSLMITDLEQIRQAFNLNYNNSGVDDHSEMTEFETERELVAVIEKVYETLRYENGWLNDENEMGVTDNDDYFTDERKRQIELIRSIVLPDIVLKSIQLLKDHRLYDSVQNLFICVMNEGNKFGTVFTVSALEMLNNVVLDVDVLENVLTKDDKAN
ncbi:nuclear pore complex protein Nup107-like [Convolutriloba macropyga]|uniref:nuclear pore complex protein Nup107-like n=1 Tax=Convolutriloba macropyga TaxID=536237 RepID=UPI003F520E91